MERNDWWYTVLIFTSLQGIQENCFFSQELQVENFSFCFCFYILVKLQWDPVNMNCQENLKTV